MVVGQTTLVNLHNSSGPFETSNLPSFVWLVETQSCQIHISLSAGQLRIHSYVVFAQTRWIRTKRGKFRPFLARMYAVTRAFCRTGTY